MRSLRIADCGLRIERTRSSFGRAALRPMGQSIACRIRVIDPLSALRILQFITLSALLVPSAAKTAVAETLHVGPGARFSSVRAAVEAAQAGDT
ncbi:MAG TPA: hypothetical protein VE398_06530, partial [Acidobacteriota bacterium]|nr:hypothetical protein [Acidobacteriota bacterium]